MRWRRDKGLNFARRGLESHHRPSGHGLLNEFDPSLLGRTESAESEEGLEPPSAGPRPAVLANWTIPIRDVLEVSGARGANMAVSAVVGRKSRRVIG